MHRRRFEEIVARRIAQMEKQAAILKSANARLASELAADHRTWLPRQRARPL